MDRVAPRTLVNVLGLLLAAVTTLFGPAGYFGLRYVNLSHDLAFKAEIVGRRAARYIYAHPEGWQFQGIRLAELTEAVGLSEHVRIADSGGDTVLESGNYPPAPTIWHSQEIVVSGTPRGSVEVIGSLRPLLFDTAVIAAFSVALGFGIYLVIRIIPMRMLARTFDELEKANRDTQEAYRRIEAQNVRFHAALDNMVHGLAMFDNEQRLVVSNRRYAAMYGLSDALVQPGTPLMTIFRARASTKAIAHDPEPYLRAVMGHVPPTKPQSMEVTLQDGRIIAISLQPISAGGWVSVHQDVTELRQAEAEKQAAELEAERLRQQERAAELASRAKSSFLAVMSHEIRTPMNAVIGLASTLLEQPLDPEQKRVVGAIHSSGESLLRLLNDILDYSKLDAGKLVFEQISFAPVLLIDQAISIVGPKAASKGLRLRNENDPNLPLALVGDAGRMRQVLLNLLSNAVKFTEAGEVVVTTRCLARTDESATVEWCVADTGIGIPADKIATLFTDYAQADSSISRRYGGTGLGLAISKGIVEQMGGTISVSSELGRGSVFSVVLSLPWKDEVPADMTPAPKTTDKLNAIIAGLERPLRILVAEDNSTNQLVFEQMLKGLDAQVHMVSSGAEALAAASQVAFDVIFMDMRMPEMDGLEATRAMRAGNGPNATAPVIAVTANAFAQDVQMCRDAGMTDFVAKPMRKQRLYDALARVLCAQGRFAAAVNEPASPLTAGSRSRPEPGVTPATAGTDDPDAWTMLIEEIGAEAACEALDVFIKETEARIRLLRSLSTDHDRNRIQVEAHTLKGTSATFGFHSLSERARSLEDAAPSVSAQDYARLLGALDNDFGRARETAARLRAAA